MAEIYLKAIPDKAQFDARYKMKREYGIKGVEVLLPRDYSTSDDQFMETMRYGAELFEGKMNIEAPPLVGRSIDFDFFCSTAGEVSRRLFSEAISLRRMLGLDGIISFHPIYHSHRDYVEENAHHNVVRTEEGCKKIRDYVERLGENGILVENLYPHVYMRKENPEDEKEKARVYFSEVGMMMNDFTKYGLGLPMTFDTAHIGITMYFCELIQANYDARMPAPFNVTLGFDKEAWKIGETVRYFGYTEALNHIIEEYNRSRLLDVVNVHLVNAGRGYGWNADHCTALDDKEGLFDMEKACRSVMKFDPKYIVPEIDEDGPQGYIDIPNTRRLLDLMKRVGV